MKKIITKFSLLLLLISIQGSAFGQFAGGSGRGDFSISMNFLLTEPIIGTITQPSCSVPTGSVDLSGLPSGSWTITGSPSGSWSGSGSTYTVTGLTADTTYTFTVSDGTNSSPESSPAVINAAPVIPSAPNATITQPTCAVSTGTITITTQSNVEYSIDGSTYQVSNVFSGLSPATYTIYVRSTTTGNCVSSSANQVINPQPVTPSAPTVGTITQPTCATATGSVALSGLPSSGSWTVTGSPSGSLSGSGTTGTVTGLTASTTYTFTVTNADGCTSTASGNAIVNAQPVTPSAPAVGTITQPTCATATGSIALSGLPSSGSWTVTGSPSGSLSGSGTTGTVTNLPQDAIYTFTVTNGDGCTSVASASATLFMPIFCGGNGKGDASNVSPAETMSNFWVASVSTSWSDAGNWSKNTVPATGENVIFASYALRDLVQESPRTVGDIVFLPEGKTINVGDVNLTVTGTIENADATRYLKTDGTGSVKRSVGTGTTVTFPVGNSTYNPVTITNNTGTADDFSVRVQDAVLMEATTDTSVNYPMVNRTWHIDKTIPSANAGGGVNFVFQWDTTQQVNDITTFALNHYNGTDWHFAADSGGTQSVSGVNPKQLTFTGYRGTFSPFAIGYDYGPLPVSWKEVRTECTTENKVTLHWSTATEINNDYFTVERSADGRNWEAVGKMPGNGTTSQEQTYVFTDAQKPSTAAAYYRIKQTDYNGAFAYSSVVVANCRAEQAVRLYPNPAQQWAVLDGVAEGTEWTMYAASGQPVAKGRCEGSRCILNTANIPAGSYVLQAGSRRMPLVIMP